MSASMPPTCRRSGSALPRAGAGLGRRGGTRSCWMAASGCGCHHHHRPLRQQGKRRRDLEKDVRVPPLLVFLDRTDIAAGEALAGLLRAGNAGSNTTADHVTVLNQALASLPASYRPGTDNPDAPQILIRSDSAGATYGFAAACRGAGVGFSLGAVIDAAIRGAVETLNSTNAWYPAIDAGGAIRDGAWVAEATALVDLDKWPRRDAGVPCAG